MSYGLSLRSLRRFWVGQVHKEPRLTCQTLPTSGSAPPGDGPTPANAKKKNAHCPFRRPERTARCPFNKRLGLTVGDQHFAGGQAGWVHTGVNTAADHLPW